MSLRYYLARRIGLAVVALIGAIVAVFLLTHILPGNPALVKAGGSYADTETIKQLEKRMGLDKPVSAQFVEYMTGVFRGDLGESFNTGRPVTEDLAGRLPATLELALASFVLAMLIALPLGIVAALNRGSWFDHLARFFVIGGASVPIFWLGLMMIFVLYYQLKLAPAPIGRLDPFVVPPMRITGLYVFDSLVTGNFAVMGNALAHLVLPSAAMAIVIFPSIAKMARAATIEVMQTDYVRTAHAIGLTLGQVVRQDALKNIMIPLLTMMGIAFGYMIAGSVLAEIVFAWPGIGLYAWNGLITLDFFAVQGFVLVVAIGYIGINLAVDLLYMVVDPRIRLG